MIVKYLFTDGSAHPQSKLGVGAFLLLDDINSPFDTLKQNVHTRLFQNTSSTKLEIQILLHALKDISNFKGKLIAYTDSQNILSLIARRNKLESQHYKTNTGKRVINEDLYREFYAFIDVLDIEFIKIQGHKKSKDKSKIDQVFSLVDKASRKALRREIEK